MSEENKNLLTEIKQYELNLDKFSIGTIISFKYPDDYVEDAKKQKGKTDEPEIARDKQWYIDNVYSRRHTAIVVAGESVQLEKGGNYIKTLEFGEIRTLSQKTYPGVTPLYFGGKDIERFDVRIEGTPDKLYRILEGDLNG